jgi:hypothetical protein
LLPFDQARDLPFVGARLAGDGVIENVIASKPVPTGLNCTGSLWVERGFL